MVTLVPEVLTHGARASVVIDVRPRPRMHVYAPGTRYRPLTVALDPGPLLRVHDPVYPKPSSYLFEPLNEEVQVYQSPFRVIRDVSMRENDPQQAPRRVLTSVVITGRLEYQACDTEVCYLPNSVPFEKTLLVMQ
jgi:hypothetical protein